MLFGSWLSIETYVLPGYVKGRFSLVQPVDCLLVDRGEGRYVKSQEGEDRPGGD